MDGKNIEEVVELEKCGNKRVEEIKLVVDDDEMMKNEMLRW